jgi:hypothetical protein
MFASVADGTPDDGLISPIPVIQITGLQRTTRKPGRESYVRVMDSRQTPDPPDAGEGRRATTKPPRIPPALYPYLAVLVMVVTLIVATSAPGWLVGVLVIVVAIGALAMPLLYYRAYQRHQADLSRQDDGP